jgi:hypothetical protein
MKDSSRRRLEQVERHYARVHRRFELWLTDPDGTSRNHNTGEVLAADELHALPEDPHVQRCEVVFVAAKDGRPA